MVKSILIVDDNTFVRQALRNTFERESDLAVCGEAENGRDAIQQARQLHPDLIVLDLSMPVMNGLDAALELKRLMPFVPIIMYSAFGDGYAKQHLSGIAEVVSKSENASTLMHKARRLLYPVAA
jgi:DNA-binding NarL/FixJ family response regulator